MPRKSLSQLAESLKHANNARLIVQSQRFLVRDLENSQEFVACLASAHKQKCEQLARMPRDPLTSIFVKQVLCSKKMSEYFQEQDIPVPATIKDLITNSPTEFCFCLYDVLKRETKSEGLF